MPIGDRDNVGPPKDKRLQLTFSETMDGGWSYAVFWGDGSEEGSLCSLEVLRERADAMDAGFKALDREIAIRACDHDWQPWGHFEKCSKCGINTFA